MLVRRWSSFCQAALGAFVIALNLGVGSAGANNFFRIVQLPNGISIDLGDQAPVIERAINGYGLVGLVQGFLMRGLTADGAAVLAYAVRYRPDQANETMRTAVRLVAQYNDTGFARQAFFALAREPAVSTEILRGVLQEVLLARPLQEAAYQAAGLAFPVGDAGALTAADVSEETEGSPEAGRTPADLFGTSLLPEVLRIGGGGGGGIPISVPNADEAGPDGGAS